MALEMSGLARLGAPEQRALSRFPWHLAVLVLSISVLGVWNLASASRSAASPVWVSQATWMGGGLLVALLALLVDYRLFQRAAWVAYGAVVLLLVAVLVKGRVVMGARRWITVGPVNFQPSELAKVAVVLALAAWFARDADRNPRGAAYGLRGIAVPGLLTLLPAALILKEPDLGTALIVSAIGATVILFAGVRWKALALLVAVVLGGSLAAWPQLKPYQRKRVESFLNPEGDALGAGYHATQSMIAVGSGQGLGKGWGQGTQTLSVLPARAAHRLHLLGVGRGARVRGLPAAARPLLRARRLRADHREQRPGSLRAAPGGRGDLGCSSGTPS